jgi:DNA-binding NarL/FixJ family response regulator
VRPDPVPVEASPGLSAREREILRLVARGLSNPAIAAELALSEHTVKRHVANILVKLNLPTRAAASAAAARAGLL